MANKRGKAQLSLSIDKGGAAIVDCEHLGFPLCVIWSGIASHTP